MARSKVTVIGAGNVGATLAHWIVAAELADVVLVDIAENPTKGKALDLFEATPVVRKDAKIIGGSDYEATRDSDVIVVTAGVPRKKDPVTGEFPSRDALVRTNQEIVGGVTKKAADLSPNAIIVVVANPLDAMCHVALHASGFPSSRVVGMAGALDTARYKSFIAEALNVSVKDVSGIVLGGHGDDMVPLPRLTSVAGIPLAELLPESTIDAIIQRARKGGGEIVGLIGVSAWYAPAAAAYEMVESIIKDQRRVIASAVLLKGEFGYDGLYVGVPAVLGTNGVEKVIEFELTDSERAMLDKSAASVRSVVEVLGY